MTPQTETQSSAPRLYEIGLLNPKGEAYIKRGFTLDEAIEQAMWGTYGILQRKEDFKWVRLVDCSSEHLFNILTYPGNIFLSPDYRDIIENILLRRTFPEQKNDVDA